MRALPSNSRHRFSHSSFSLRQRPMLEIPNDDNPFSKVGEEEWYDLEDGGGKRMKEEGEKKGNRGREGIDTRGNTEKSIGPSTAKLVTVPCTRI